MTQFRSIHIKYRSGGLTQKNKIVFFLYVFSGSVRIKIEGQWSGPVNLTHFDSSRCTYFTHEKIKGLIVAVV
jgi:hypothetical protein